MFATPSNHWQSSRQSAQLQPRALILFLRSQEFAAKTRCGFTLVPEYLLGDTVEAQKNDMDYGIQLGRRFRALKAWVIFRSFGREGMAARLRESVRLARLLAD